jgi:hypothetical protein
MEVIYMSDRKSDEDRRGMLIGGLITLGVGIFFILYTFGIIPDMGRMWPIFPIIVGISLIFGSFYKSRKSDEPENR